MDDRLADQGILRHLNQLRSRGCGCFNQDVLQRLGKLCVCCHITNPLSLLEKPGRNSSGLGCLPFRLLESNRSLGSTMLYDGSEFFKSARSGFRVDRVGMDSSEFTRGVCKSESPVGLSSTLTSSSWPDPLTFAEVISGFKPSIDRILPASFGLRDPPNLRKNRSLIRPRMPFRPFEFELLLHG